MTGRSYCAVYDFGLFPYALGDVLTWNVQTAIRCEELGRERVDAYICVDERQLPNFFQKDLITADNCELFFNEVFGAFGTSVAAAWLASGLGDAVKFFVDEDPAREGRLHLGRPILRPEQVPPGAVAYLAFVREVSAAISRRLADLPVSFAALSAQAA